MLSTGLPLSVWEPKVPTQRTQFFGQGPCLMHAASGVSRTSTCIKERQNATPVYSLDGATLLAAGQKRTAGKMKVFLLSKTLQNIVGVPFYSGSICHTRLGGKKNSLQKYCKWICCNELTFYLLAVIKVGGNVQTRANRLKPCWMDNWKNVKDYFRFSHFNPNSLSISATHCSLCGLFYLK